MGKGGGGGKKGGAAPAPDFSKAAMVNQQGPMGGSQWTTGPDGKLTLTSGFSGPANQTFGELQAGMQKGALMDPSQAGQNAFNKTMGSYESVLDPRWDAKQQQLNTGLANQGLQPGEEASANAQREFGTQRNAAYDQAIAGAIQTGQGEQAQARANAAQPFQLAGGMMSMIPHGDPGAPFAAANAQYQAARNTASANNAKKGSTLGGIGDIAGLALGGPLGMGLGGAIGTGLGQLLGGGGGGGQGTGIDLGSLMPGGLGAGSLKLG